MSNPEVYTVILKVSIRHDGKERSKGEALKVTKTQADRLASLGVAEFKPAGNPPVAGKPPSNANGNENDKDLTDPRDPEFMSIDELKQELSLMNVPYQANTPKAKLLELYKEAKEKQKGSDGE